MWKILFFWKVFYEYNTTPQLWIIQSIIDANIDIIKVNINNKFLHWIGESHGGGIGVLIGPSGPAASAPEGKLTLQN